MSPLTRARAAGQVFLLALALAGCSGPAAPEIVWVGHLAPLTGPRQAEGEQACQAIELALSTVRMNQELFDGRELGVRHVDVSRPAEARAEAARLLAVNQVVALLVGPGVTGVEEVIATARTHEAAVLLLDGTADAPPEGGVVVLGAGPAARGQALAAYAEKGLKLKRVALVVDHGDKDSLAARSAFAAAWAPGGGHLREWGVEAAPAAILAEKPQAVVLALPPGKITSIPWGGQVPPVPLLVLGEEAEHAIRLALGDRAEVHIVTDYAPEAVLPSEAQAWRDAFQSRYRHVPRRAAALARDGMELLFARMRQKGTARAVLRSHLKAVPEVPTLTGQAVLEKGLARRALFVVRAQGGKREVVWSSP